MGRGKKKIDGFCEICGRLFAARVTAYQHRPFIDGKNYEAICDVCNNVPKMWDYNPKTDTLTAYRTWDPGRLMSVEEMVKDDGWDKKEAAESIKAVRDAIKRAFGKIPSPGKPEIHYSRCFKDDPIKPPVTKVVAPTPVEPVKKAGKKPKFGNPSVSKPTAIPKYGKKQPIPIDPDEDTSFDMD